MGTNYYVESDEPCEACRGNGKRRVHIGKSSGGWKFLFNPFRKSFAEWCAYLQSHTKIWDEYGAPQDKDELINFIVEKQKTCSTHWQSGEESERHEFIDRDGYRISRHEEFS